VVLERARSLGFLGKGPVHDHLEHALAYAAALPEAPSGRVADLGTGGGIPALPLALAWPQTTWTLVDRGDRRTAFLQDAVRRLDLGDRATVITGGAEQVGQHDQHRGRYQLVTARSFGPPAEVAECAAGLLAPGGTLLVSEPPEPDEARWPAEKLEVLGLGPAQATEVSGIRIAAIAKVTETPAKYPRRKITRWP
jgi:16S rRNA (guanine527-N7)-methyltransferase